MSEESSIAFRPIDYSNLDLDSTSCPDCNDSGVAVSPVNLPSKYRYAHPQGHRIIPPSIAGHGRLIVAHRTIPYWGGAVIIVGSFAWAVVCGMSVSSFLGV